MTKIDCLIEVAKTLREARSFAERSSDRALLYFIDMTIAHVCDFLIRTRTATAPRTSTRVPSKPLRERWETLSLRPMTNSAQREPEARTPATLQA